MKLRIIDAKDEPRMRVNALVISEDFGLVAFVYSDFRKAKAVAECMVKAFNEHETHVAGCKDEKGNELPDKPGDPCECWCHPY